MITRAHNRPPEETMTDQSRSEANAPSSAERFFGGSPGGVIVRLLLISLVVGFLMSVLGFDVRDVVHGAVNLFREALRDGFGIFRNLGFYILTGAALVVPIWLLIRLTKGR
jgi:uncharacterized membrane protein